MIILHVVAVDPNEDCGGCVDRKGSAPLKWHRRRGQEPCARAREEARRQRKGRNPWTPGSPILVPEIDPL